MERNKLKELLIRIKEQEYKALEEIKPIDLALIMMHRIGDIDGELRDDLILTTLWHWIVKGILGIEETRKILNISIDDKHLFYGIGQADDTIFTRTFSVLVTAICFSMHLDNKYLNKDEIDTVYNRVVSYYNEEKDLRGYIDGKGWAHGAAHGADALGELAKCEDVGHGKLIKILEAFSDKVKINNYSYINNEEERMISAVVAVLERKVLEETEVIDWVKSFDPLDKIEKYPEDMTLEINVKNFLESLYFRLLDRPEYVNVVDAAIEAIKEINSFLKRKDN